jgi:FixJ family two-component response regulator
MRDSPAPTIFVVDDHPHMRSALRRLLIRAGFAVELFASGSEFLGAPSLDGPGCILLDVSMPEMTGLEVQARLKKRRITLPIIFLTGTADIPIAVAAMREGAVDFIQKPFDNDDLLARVRQAVAQHSRAQGGAPERSAVLRGLDSLTPREREVMELVVAGRTSKEIARIIGASHRTVEIHRSRLMQKMAAATVADLVRMRMLLTDTALG